MPSQPAIPPPLSSHLQPALFKGSLSLVTSVLGASANWIILRQIYAALKVTSGHQEESTAVILLSWLRGLDVWRDGARRLGLNLSPNGRITFIDALQSGLGLQDRGIGEFEEVVLKAITEAKATSARILLVLDGIDFLLAATETTVDDLLACILEFREHVYTIIVTASADYPLIQAQRSPLELDHAAFVMSMAHEANVFWGVRELDTGSARDVSGVLRITRGPAIERMEFMPGEDIEEKELLYCVAGDGGVRVFERGSSEGYLVLWQAPQQVPHTVQTLRYVAPEPQKNYKNLDWPVAVPSTSKSTPAHHAAILRLRFVNVHNWGEKAKRRKTTGTGRMRSMKLIPRKFKNGFQTGVPKGSKGPSTNA
ncbi:MAG: hypothetical protein Q9226_000296 [Calogaya cf. arnoldii]